MSRMLLGLGALGLLCAACPGKATTPPTGGTSVVVTAAPSPSPAAPTVSVAPQPSPTGAPSVSASAEPGPVATPSVVPTGVPSGSGRPPWGGKPNIVSGTEPCKTDADCVPASCCHAASCTSKAHAPQCQQVMCTADCRGGTMDCGGGCLCQDGKCAARMAH